MGIFKGELELSSEPVLGGWKIHVEVEPEQKRQSHLVDRLANWAEKQEKLNPRGPQSTPSRPNLQESLTFKVDRYILPFEVTIKTPPFLTFNSTQVPVQVQARYTYGKGVSGQCTFRAKFLHYNGQPSSTTHVAIQEGSVMAELNLAPLLDGLRNLYDTRIELEASVTENVTGIVRKAST